MIELDQDTLVFRFRQVHEDAALRIDLQRTLRIPNDEREHPLPPGLGRFPLLHVDDHRQRVPESWVRHGGVMLPMYQAEAMWLNFRSPTGYPFAVKVATGKINALSGEPWSDGIHRDPQDYMVVPGQPWLDGFCVERGVIRQFVASPLGAGDTVEEQLTGEAEHGGLQIVVYPLKKEVWKRMQRERMQVRRDGLFSVMEEDACYAMPSISPDMGLAAGGRMRQEIYEDEHDFSDWDLRASSRCFVHIANSLAWKGITGKRPPTEPPTAEDYTRAGLPWYAYYDHDRQALEGSKRLGNVRPVGDEKARFFVDLKGTAVRGTRAEVREGKF